MIEWDPTRSKWSQIADEIVRRIDAGVYQPHTLILEIRLAEEFGVARLTVRKAIAHLREAGVVRTEPGIGSSIMPRKAEE
ncbi:winged helix-turn-helix domain-containing protein [Microbispora sp. NPDC049633]|uniref:winged helix-turn-helix domain-containing protein n=1 Tax=Microbispora sp. NPDC049633 TaxID=3154355 RepID=UPI00341C6D65